ncbi:Uncharacterised protein [Enterobacter asburiae]|uniref:Uncharacterized protein n=1 Tax=Enterobacter asburiae TaxID=61645 RepID=A0A376F9W2_ENTAS|nr:Uncharacterised protein [Enterobacter asburiae]
MKISDSPISRCSFCSRLTTWGLNGDVQRGNRLIADNQLRFEDQRTGNTNTLALTAGDSCG